MHDRIGPYRVEGEIGRGGMGVVYRATDERLDRVVAIKALPPELASDPTRLERFEREAKTLASVNHQNLAGIHGVEEQGGHKYLILEYVEGETLADRLDRGPLPADEAIEVCVQIASGIEAAHDAGVIHRDLKPSNIKITPEGRVKVLDFGLAKGDSGASSSGSGFSQSPTMTTPVPHRSPTVEGAVLGTAAYMSPEQARGRGVDKRTDIWSFGVILYECLTGVGPFIGETATDSIGAVLHKEVDLGRLPPGTPTMVRHVLARCLERDKNRRYRDIADVRLELERAEHGSIDDRAETAARRGPAAWLGWALAVLALAGVAWMLVSRPKPVPPALVRTSIVMPEGMEILDPTISPNGRRIAIVAKVPKPGGSVQETERRLYFRDLGSDELTLVPGAVGVHDPKYSPDGRTLAYLVSEETQAISGWSLYRVAADLSTPPVKVMTIPDAYRMNSQVRFSWTPDGNIAFVQQTPKELLLVDPGTGREVRRMPVVDSEQDNDYVSLTGPFLSDSISIQTQRFDEVGYHIDVALLNTTTGVLRNILPDTGDVQLLPSGDLAFTRGDTLYTAGFDPKTLQLTGQVHAVQSGIVRESSWEHGWFSLSDTGTLLYVPGGDRGGARNLVVTEPDGRETVWGEEPRAYVERVAISPDGQRLAVIVSSPRGVFEIWVSEVEHPRLRRLLATPGADYYAPVFTRDGEHLIVAHWNPAVEGPGQILLARFDGTEPPVKIAKGSESGEWVEPTSVSPDGTHALIQRFSPDNTSVDELSLDGSGTEKVLLKGAMYYLPTYAPGESHLISYVSDETGRMEAYVRRYDENGLGPAIPVTSRGADAVRWIQNEDGTLALRCVSLEFKEFVIPILDTQRLKLGEPVPSGRVPTHDNVYVDIALTGRAIGIQRGEDEKPATRMELVQGWTASLESPGP